MFKIIELTSWNATMIGFVLFAAAAAAQHSEDPCAAVGACRQVGVVRIENAAGQEALLPVNQTLPWIAQDHLLLFPGDWIIVQLVSQDDVLVPRLVRASDSGEPPEPADGQIRIKLHRFDKGTLIMEVLSHRPEILDYAALAVVGLDKPQWTSVCSLSPGVPVFEAWRWPIRQIALSGFRPTKQPGCKTLNLEDHPPSTRHTVRS